MIPSDVLQKKIAALPEPVQDYLYSEQSGDLNEKIIDRNKLLEGQEPMLFVLLRELFVQELTLDRLVPEIKERFNFDDLKAKQLALDVAGFRLLPLDRWLGDVSGYIRSHGGDPAAYPPERVPMIERTRDEAATEVVDAAASAAAASARLKGRLHDVVESFLAGVRTEEQTQEVLTKAEKIGGIGLDADAAKRLITEAKVEARSVIIKSRPAGGEIPAAAGETPVPEAAAPAKKSADFATITREDEEEIAKIEREVMPSRGAEQGDETARRIEDSIEEIYLASGLKTDDEAMAKRVKTVIGNRLRDVRDQMETLEIMVQPKELGGLGMNQDAARATLNAIQGKLKQVHDEHAVQAMTDKTNWVEKEKQQKVEGEEREKQGELTDLERLYSSIVSKSKKAMRNAPPSVPNPAAQAPGTAAVPGASVASAPPNLPVTTANPIPLELRAPSVVPLPEPPVAAPAPAAPPLTVVRPMPGVPVMPQVQGTMDAPKPRMDDVKPMARVTGPVEELRAITIVDFRRLSKDPTESCVKIKDKIDILAEQSYTRRTEAIAAWGASEVVRTYLELMGEGLNGIPLKDAVAARQAARKPYLTPEEFQAVGALSRQLRY